MWSCSVWYGGGTVVWYTPPPLRLLHARTHTHTHTHMHTHTHTKSTRCIKLQNSARHKHRHVVCCYELMISHKCENRPACGRQGCGVSCRSVSHPPTQRGHHQMTQAGLGSHCGGVTVHTTCHMYDTIMQPALLKQAAKIQHSSRCRGRPHPAAQAQARQLQLLLFAHPGRLCIKLLRKYTLL